MGSSEPGRVGPSSSREKFVLNACTRVGWIARIAFTGWHSGVPYMTVLPPIEQPMAPIRSPSTSGRVRR